MNLVLIGMMGSGKTTLGRRLALKLGYEFIDTDQKIEQEQGCSIEEIFKYTDEATFRKLETMLLEQLLGSKNCIIATGGGIVLKPENFELMRQIGTILYLELSIEAICKRIDNKTNKRPLLKGDIKQKLTQIFKERQTLYEQADHSIRVDRAQAKIIVQKIYDQFFIN